MHSWGKRVMGMLACVVAGEAGCMNDGFNGQSQYRGGGGPGAPRCAQYTTCRPCAAALGCGWCTIGGAGRCASEPNACSPNGEAFSWTWEQAGCPAAPAADAGATPDGGADGGVADAPRATATDGGGAFKSATADGVAAGPGITNLIALTFTAPTAGFVWVTGTGTCGLTAALPVDTEFSVTIETSPTMSTSSPGGVTFSIPAAAVGSSRAFSVARTLPAAGGVSSVYLNIDNPSAGGRLSCSAALTAFFSAQQLP